MYIPNAVRLNTEQFKLCFIGIPYYVSFSKKDDFCFPGSQFLFGQLEMCKCEGQTQGNPEVRPKPL